MSEHEGIWTEYRPTYWDGWSACKRMGDLVRCMDCKRFSGYELEPHSGYCERYDLHEVRGNGFCAWGVRRTDG